MEKITRMMDYIFVVLIIIFTAILPVLKFVIAYLKNVYEHGETYKMAIIELWRYMDVVNGNWFLFISPISILILISFGQKRRIFNESSFVKVFLRPIYVILGYSVILLLLALILPTRVYFPYDHISIDDPILILIFTNINLVMFTIFVSSIGIITSKYIKNTYLNILGSLVVFIAILLGLFLIGSSFEGVFQEGFNSDWFYIYNVFWFDSGVSIAFSTIFIFVLMLIGIGVVYLTFKENKHEYK